MASTHESGRYPQSVNLVTSGTKWPPLFIGKVGDDSTDFGLLTNTRTATNGPSGRVAGAVRACSHFEHAERGGVRHLSGPGMVAAAGR
jgi:hypothetical protein